MNQLADLKLKALAIGSLPHNNLGDAMSLVKKDFSEIPFFPQLANINKNEDMIIQVLEGLPSFLPYNPENFVLDVESEIFMEGLEEFFTDYEEIVSGENVEKLEKYGFSKDFSSSFPVFEKIISDTKPIYAKGQIVGPFTLATTLTDNNGKAVVYDETLRDIIVKLLCLKALWQINRIKGANSDTVPIIFMDEPSISQLGTSAYLTINEYDVSSMIREVSDFIKDNGGVSAIHCCGKCDWVVPIAAEVNIINFDAYAYSEHFALFNSIIDKNFLQKGGKIAWGLVPTLDSDALNSITIDELLIRFDNCVKNLTKRGIDEKLIIENSLVTSSCGAGSLTIELAERAMDLVNELSQRLRKRF